MAVILNVCSARHSSQLTAGHLPSLACLLIHSESPHSSPPLTAGAECSGQANHPSPAGIGSFHI